MVRFIKATYLISLALVLTVYTKKSSNKNSIRNIRDNEYRVSFDPSHIEKMDKQICIDFGIFISPTVKENAIKYGTDFKTFIRSVLRHMVQIFLWHNIRLNVAGIKIYDEDPFSRNNTINQDLNDMVKLIKKEGTNYDVNMYLKYTPVYSGEYDGGEANEGSVCTENAVGTFNMNFLDIRYDVGTTASNIVHEIGHLLGFDHTDENSRICKCGYDQRYCIMHWQGRIQETSQRRSFEKCAIKQLQNSIDKYPCLNKCNYKSQLNGFCGDGIVQDDEDCDCGFKDRCKLEEENRCCLPGTCKFRKTNYQCSKGECCTKCMFTKGNVYCRKDPDTGKYLSCNGDSAECTEQKERRLPIL